jgi:2-methylisocitrate lyase-like PEP mutase family enzyme
MRPAPRSWRTPAPRPVATSSAAVAWAHGYPDGDTLPLAKLFSTIETVARVVKAPVTADIEGGYTDDLGELAETIHAVIGAGAVGINLEDGRRDAALHARKIEAARKAADAAGVPLFINARIDVYLKGLADGDAAFTETVERAAQYAAAGADGIFVPGPSDNDLIGRLAEAITLPLNIMLCRSWPRRRSSRRWACGGSVPAAAPSGRPIRASPSPSRQT